MKRKIEKGSEEHTKGKSETSEINGCGYKKERKRSE